MFKKILFILTAVFCMVVLFCGSAFSFPLLVSVNSDDISTIQWLFENWELVLLVVSELLAFLPTKWSGLVKMLLSLAGKIISLLAKRNKY